MKLYGKKADEKAFAAFRDVVKAEAKKAKAYAYYREKAAQSIEISSVAASSIALAYLPRLYQPTTDINNGNGLIDTYAKVFDERIYGYSLPGKYIIEVTFVFADEDHPNSILDRMYDTLRLTTWGRIEDLETFFIVVDKQTWSSEKLSFIKLWLLGYVEGVRKVLNVSAYYSGDETWNAFIGSHLRAKITTFRKYYQHPILYVNVWNHAIGEEDNNPLMAKTKHDTWLTYTTGSRMDAENDYNIDYEYLNEGIYEKP